MVRCSTVVVDFRKERYLILPLNEIVSVTRYWIPLPDLKERALTPCRKIYAVDK